MGKRLFFALLLTIGACQAKQRTMLVVQVDSNMDVPTQLNKVDVAITVNGITKHWPYSLISDYKLPLHVGVVEASDGAGDITIVASGYLDPNSTAIVSETAIVGFVEGDSMELKLYLASECIAKACDQNKTCTMGGNCREKARKPSELVPFVSAAAAGSSGSGGSSSIGGNSVGGGKSGVGGTSGGGGTSSSGLGGGDAGVQDAPGAQPDVPIGGTGGGTGGIAASGGSGGSSGGGTGIGGSGGSSGGATISGGTTSSSRGGSMISGGTSSIGGMSSIGGTTGSSGGATGMCAAGPNVISDFESGKGNMIRQGGRSGWWYVYYPGSPYSPLMSGQSQTPAVNISGPIAAAADPDVNACSKYALHSTGSGFVGSGQDYAGFGAGFVPKDATGLVFTPYDTSAYTGVKFKIKTGSGTAPATYFEVPTQDTMSSAQGGLLGPEGNPNDIPVGLHNNRGFLLNDPWLPGGITSAYQTIAIPFGYLVSRWVPAPVRSSGAVCVAGGPQCQAPTFNPAHAMGIQFSFYSGDSAQGFPVVGTPGTYDIWIDDVQFTTDDSGLQTRPGFPLPNPGSLGSCLTPKGPSASAKFLVPAYNMWKATFVKNGKVIRPENGNDTVSEGIAYGMLIAVNMNDQTLFDSLYSTWKANTSPGTGTLMTWCLGSGGGTTGTACPTSGGTATDADEDAAFALLQAEKVWGGGDYKAAAMKTIADIWNYDIDGTGTKLPKGGSRYGSPATDVTSASYFAPAYYLSFLAVDAIHDWKAVFTAVYEVINGQLGGGNGLIPAWCGSTCTVAASSGAATDVDYQYDAHRIPMRIGIDYCFNATLEAKNYTAKTTAFFATAGANGLGYIQDMYTPSGSPVTGAAYNSASILGTAAVGAMAAGNQAFLNSAYQAVFDTITRGSMAPVDPAGKTDYSYHNATVGLLTALIMTGNFMH
jgi:endo-1,4-beta-D-glucanase Y